MTVALIAGQGGLPPRLVTAMLAKGDVPVICEMEPFKSEVTGELPRLSFRLETLGTFLATLKEIGVTQICMAGAVRRPDIDPALIDAATVPLIAQVQNALMHGDDGTLRAIIALFEAEGFEVIGAADIMPELLPAAGVVCGDLPDGIDADMSVAEIILADMGRADLGQALIVRNGDLIAREDDRGTDAMLEDFCPEVERPSFPGDPLEAIGWGVEALVEFVRGNHETGTDYPAEGGILFKAPKPGQELRADMPVIGLQTAMHAAEAGLAGIVVKAGGVMVLNIEGVKQVLQAHKMFLWVRP